ncbi:MAG: S-layer protein [Firmicutes bacterium]|nr:S-layer protein [Bacillota bacterium]
MFGLGNFKYENHDLGTDYGKSMVGNLRLALKFDYRINEDWSVFNGQEFTRSIWVTPVGDITATNSKGKELGVVGKIGETTLTVGDYHYFSAYGYMYDFTMNGVQLDFGRSAPGAPAAGKRSPTVSLNYGYLCEGNNQRTDDLFSDSDPHIFSGELCYPISDTTNLQFGRWNLWSDNPTISARHFSTGGFDVKLTKDLMFAALYAKSSYDTENIGYITSLFYKHVDPMNPGSYGIMLQNEHIESNATINPSFAVNPLHGAKGVLLDYQFCPAKKMWVELLFTRIKATKANDTFRDNFYSWQIFYLL